MDGVIRRGSERKQIRYEGERKWVFLVTRSGPSEADILNLHPLGCCLSLVTHALSSPMTCALLRGCACSLVGSEQNVLELNKNGRRWVHPEEEIAVSCFISYCWLIDGSDTVELRVERLF